MNRNSKHNAMRWAKTARRRIKNLTEKDTPISYVSAYAEARANG